MNKVNNPKKLVIAINGIATSGKDELVTQICKTYNTKNFRISNISSVDNVKVIAAENFGWDGVKDEKGRNLLSALKDASTEYNNKPFNDYVNKILCESGEVFFVHIREVDEIEALRLWCSERDDIDFISLKVIRDSVDNKYVNNTGDRGATEPYNYDQTLYNRHTLNAWVEQSLTWFDAISEHLFGKLDANVR